MFERFALALGMIRHKTQEWKVFNPHFQDIFNALPGRYAFDLCANSIFTYILVAFMRLRYDEYKVVKLVCGAHCTLRTLCTHSIAPKSANFRLALPYGLE